MLPTPLKGRLYDFVGPYFKGADLDAVIILKAREPARIMTAIGDSKANRWHQSPTAGSSNTTFYINDRQWGRMFVRIRPYPPFSRPNQHHWLANPHA